MVIKCSPELTQLSLSRCQRLLLILCAWWHEITICCSPFTGVDVEFELPQYFLPEVPSMESVCLIVTRGSLQTDVTLSILPTFPFGDTAQAIFPGKISCLPLERSLYEWTLSLIIINPCTHPQLTLRTSLWLPS